MARKNIAPTFTNLKRWEPDEASYSNSDRVQFEIGQDDVKEFQDESDQEFQNGIDARTPPSRQFSRHSRASSGSSSFQQLLDEVHGSMEQLNGPMVDQPQKFSDRKISPNPIAVSGAGVAFLYHDARSVPEKAEDCSSPVTPTTDFSPTHQTSYSSWRSQDETRREPKYKPAQRAQSVFATSRNNLNSDSSSDKLSYYHETLLASKHLHTNQLISLHNLKTKLTKYQNYVERAFTLVNVDTEDAIIEGLGIIAKVMTKSWAAPKIGHDLAYGLCDYLRETGNLDKIIQCFVHTDTPSNVRMASGRALEECCSAKNRDYIVTSGFLKPIVLTAKDFASCSSAEIQSSLNERIRISISLMESLFKHSPETSEVLIDLSTLSHVIATIKTCKCSQILRHCALAMANLTMYSDTDCHQKMVDKKVQDWLFLLASHQDDITRYYACLAICMLVSNKEIEAAVIKSGTLSLVEPFLLAHKPEDFAMADYKHSQGRPQAWLQKLVPMLGASRFEARSLAAFHFAMEAGIKKEQEKLVVFQEIGAIDALKVVAARPEEVGPKFARLALKIIGEEVPYKLSQQVPLWSIEDVKYWVKNIGFEGYADRFADQMVDGDLLLLLTDLELQKDIGMDSGLLRKRFMRELASLKIAADYSCVDETHMDQFLMSLNPYYSVYTYQMLELGIETGTLQAVTEEILKSQCGVVNPIHSSKMAKSFQDLSQLDDMEIAILSKHIEIFISYRRSTGNQLASLIKVLLQLRGYKVFIDVDRLYAGKFDASLLKNIQAAKHFILVLTPQALDRCAHDEDCEDWVHKEVRCALDHQRNIILVFDPSFDWPDDSLIPSDMLAIRRFNGIRWVHEYQEACVDKLEKFIKGEVNKGGLTGSYHGNTGGLVVKNPSNWRSRSKTSLAND